MVSEFLYNEPLIIHSVVYDDDIQIHDFCPVCAPRIGDAKYRMRCSDGNSEMHGRSADQDTTY